MFDHIALGIAQRITKNINEFSRYKLIERLFIILPYMHSENLENCENSVQLIARDINGAKER